MEQKHTDRKLLFKGVKYLAATFPMFFIGPVLINTSLKNQDHPYFYLVFGLGCLVCVGSMLLFFKGLQTIMKSLFGK
ncbi:MULTISPECIES: DUF6095 family protein [Myroides]|uniref:Uncharacterized protein n=1 Tax=Myroides albus TaxID=2562892 RepID=A0A6I3LM76_9FLAO|nr:MULTISPECIES: DUF6095 family protein [Myroides]MTG98606.1 hypothetical protein [Myroides albus]MVX35876.1 hypothetical protein [Myroides sp. LoEW2-1]UVD79976.1 DUF6095 family protein [Myroides albus]